MAAKFSEHTQQPTTNSAGSATVIPTKCRHPNAVTSAWAMAIRKNTVNRPKYRWMAGQPANSFCVTGTFDHHRGEQTAHEQRQHHVIRRHSRAVVLDLIDDLRVQLHR